MPRRHPGDQFPLLRHCTTASERPRRGDTFEHFGPVSPTEHRRCLDQAFATREARPRGRVGGIEIETRSIARPRRCPLADFVCELICA